MTVIILPHITVRIEPKMIFLLKIFFAFTGDNFNIQNFNPSTPILFPDMFAFTIPEISNGKNKNRRIFNGSKKLISSLSLIFLEKLQKNKNVNIKSGIKIFKSLLASLKSTLKSFTIRYFIPEKNNRPYFLLSPFLISSAFPLLNLLRA